MQVGDIMSKYECGKIVTGCVTGVENYGIFVSLDEYYSGLIHISEISTKFVKDINDYVITMEKMYPHAYNKKKAGPYTKTRVILMNGTEYESVWFLHQFARNCEVDEIKRAIAVVRKQEQQQQKRISCFLILSKFILDNVVYLKEFLLL